MSFKGKFENCNVVWGSCCQSYLNNLNTIQKKIIRIMSFKGKFENAAPLFYDFHVLTIGNIDKFMCLLYVHRCLLEECNDVLSAYEVINYRTRLADSNSLTIPDVRYSLPPVSTLAWQPSLEYAT